MDTEAQSVDTVAIINNEDVNDNAAQPEECDTNDNETLPDLVLNQARSVVTPKLNASLKTTCETDVTAVMDNTPKRSGSELDSQPSMTPRSVLTDPDASELEMANTLLQLRNLDDDLLEIDKHTSNEELMPVDRPCTEDFAKDLAEADARNATEQYSNNAGSDSDKTVDYTVQDKDQGEPADKDGETTSPKAVMRYKHYDIRRHSPNVPNTIHKMRRVICNAMLDSKKELSHHHRMEHSDVSCPDCSKTFPTPDALQHHRDSHKPDHQFQCKICGKQCTFQSDLDRHTEKHDDNRCWRCPAPECDREFKRKAELT